MAGIKTVYVIGRSNVGKSATLRALTGKKVPSGRRPGLTLEPSIVERGPIRYVDMPGFGFMSGVPGDRSERIKNKIVNEIEESKESINLVLLIVDAKAFAEVCQRWEARGEIPIDVELKAFVEELGLPFLIVPNRMDKVRDPEAVLDAMAGKFGYLPPWRQWMDVIFPISAKTGAGVPYLKLEVSKKLGLT